MRKLLYIATVALILSACGNGSQKTTEHKAAKGGVKYGGAFRYNETEYLKSLYPLNITEVVGHHIISQIYEGLTTFNPADLTIDPCLAQSWTVSPDGKTYTFKIRPGVFFQDDPCFKDSKGRLVTAHDFVYCLNLLCTPDPKNNGFSFFRDIVKGATQHYEDIKNGKQVGEVEGVKAPDDSTLQIELEKPCPSFLERLALPFTAVFPKEAIDYYKSNISYHTVGTGPFMLKALKQDEAAILVRNNNYWGKDEYGNQLPYLDAIKVSFIKEDKTEMLEFQKGDMEMKYRLPFDMIDEILDDQKQLKGEYKKFVLQVQPELTTQYYGFLIPDKIFSNKNVRLAFNYAVDRAKIAEYSAKGEGIPAFNGFVPLGMPGYDNNLVKGYNFDVKKAKDYLAKAGYPNGKGFPKVTLEINSGGGRNEKIAEAVQKMLMENLNINVEITQVIWAQHINNIETAKVGFWRFAWIADYPDPENFLNLYYGANVPKTFDEASYMNPTRYINPQYDALFEKAIATTNEAERNKLYARLDQMIVDDAPFLLIYYSVNRRLIQPYVKNFYNNGMDYRKLREVWLDK
ncbi:MAG TPA: ABC transporter substrate-binding protein [Chitinophagales bacterium]|nr:ABC transporter substrate-binding protein [Chitinophagales bacterium]